MVGSAIGDRQITASDGPRDEEGAGFNAVGDHGVLGAVKFLHAANVQRGSGVARDAGSHLAKHDDEVGHFRLAGGIFEKGFAVGEGGGHQNIFGSGDGDFFEDYVRALQAAAIANFGFNVAMGHGNFGAHFFERSEMQIDGPRADSAAAGKGNTRDAHAGHERAERKNRGAHRFHQFVRGLRVIQCGGANGVIAGGDFGGGNGGAHKREQLAHGDEVADFGDVVDGDLVRSEQGSGHHRQRGVFRAADAHGSVQGFAAFD